MSQVCENCGDEHEKEIAVCKRCGSPLSSKKRHDEDVDIELWKETLGAK